MVKFVVFDFDGVFTDGTITFDNNGLIHKSYNVKDGLGLKLLDNSNILVGVISGYKENISQNEIIKHLNINYYSCGNNNKLDVLYNWCVNLDISLDEVAYMGDDINDIEIMNKVKISGCPKNAHSNCIQIANFVSTKNGGKGCIREFCEYILNIIE